jgi:hypothetical protein
MTTENHKTDGSALVASARDAARPNYLGSPDVVDRLVRDMAARVLDRFEKVESQVLDRRSASTADQDDCKALAAILVGSDPKYTSMPDWTGKGLADYIRRRLSNVVQDGSDVDVIAQALATLVHYLYDLMRQLGEGAGKQQVAEAGADACKSMAFMLTGIEGHD